MSRKLGGFFVFAATSFAFLGTTIVRQENFVHAIVAIILIGLAGMAIKDHFNELNG